MPRNIRRPIATWRYRVHASGRTLAEPVHYDGRAETEALKRRYAVWLAGAEPRPIVHQRGERGTKNGGGGGGYADRSRS